jgi:hypothetical protein
MVAIDVGRLLDIRSERIMIALASVGRRWYGDFDHAWLLL